MTHGPSSSQSALELRKGTNIWVGGRFSRVEQRNGTVLGSVANVAVFDSKTEECRKGVAPSPGGKGDDVFDMALYGDDVLIADNFPGPFVLRTHHAPSTLSQSVLRIASHTRSFQGSAIVPTILSFLSRALKRCLHP
jgi:hypothetical protein